MNVVRIGVVLPATFNLNADAANARVLAKRLTLSGVDTEIVALDEPESMARAELDALIIGSPSSSILTDPNLPRAEIADLVAASLDRSIPILAVSNGFHLLGAMTGRDGEIIEGLGVIPVRTTFGRKQHVSIGARVDTGSYELIGVENHNARVEFDDIEHQLGGVVRGTGNDWRGSEGYSRGSLTATHLHGPLFALNPAFADNFCRELLARRGATFVRGAALDDLDRLSLAAAAHLDRRASS